MATVIPFKAFRPTRDKVHLVASRSYISYRPASLRSKLNENPYTFLHIINPEHGQKTRTRPNSKARFEKINKRFYEFVADEIFLQDDKPHFYVYRQIKDGHAYVGIIGCAAVEDYDNNVIKKHEATITRREEVFKEYLKAVEINAEPVCFTYPNNQNIDRITAKVMQDRAEYDFTTTNRVQHTFWLVSDTDQIQEIQNSFQDIPAIYIADGHHRSASSALLGKEVKGDRDIQLASDYFMGIFIPETALKIYEFNRLVKSIAPLSEETFLKAVEERFEVEKVNMELFQPQAVREIGMYLNRQWYCLQPKAGIVDENDLVCQLDVSILSDHLLAPILDIHDLKTDERIAFMGGPNGLSSVKQAVDKGEAAVAFAHFPVTMEQLKAISDADLIMPPKSTWIEPKLRSGLTVYSLVD